jgi:uncharacterized protein
MNSFRESGGGTSFRVRVHPRAKKNAIRGQVGDALKIALAVAPVEGRANAACIEFVADLLNVPRASVTIIAGHSSRSKVIRVAGVSARQVEERLRAAMPQGEPRRSD